MARYFHTSDDYKIVLRDPCHKKFPYLLTRRRWKADGTSPETREDVAAFANKDDAITAAKALDMADNPNAYNDE